MTPRRVRTAPIAAMVALIAILAASGCSLEASALIGEWEGTLTVRGAEVPLRLKVTKGPDGKPSATLDSVTQGAKGIPMASITQTERRIVFVSTVIKALCTGGRRYPGSPRIHDDFIEWGERVSRKRVIRLPQEEDLIARVVRRYTVTTDCESPWI